MKPSITSVFLLIHMTFLGQITENDTTISCMAYWKKGEQKVILISRKKESYNQSKLTSTFNLSYEAHVSVLDSAKDGYTIQWVFHLPAILKALNPELAASMPVYEGLKMIFTTTNSGSFKELLNWEEVRDAFVAMMELSLPKDMSDSTKEAVNNSINLFNSREMTESALIKEIQLYHSPYGGIFTTKGISGVTSISSPFGGEEFPATVTLRITENNPSLKYYKANFTQEIDKVNAKTMLDTLFRKLNIPSDSADIKLNDLLSSIEIKDQNDYTITKSTGWIEKLHHKRIGAATEMKQVEEFTFVIKRK